MPSILLFTNWEEVSKLKQEIQEHNKQLQTSIYSLTTGNGELKSRVTNLESGYKDIKDGFRMLIETSWGSSQDNLEESQKMFDKLIK